MTKFEYATVVFDTKKFFSLAKLDHEAFRKKLNEYGAEGWELVNTIDLSRYDGGVLEITAIFKRPVTHQD